MPCTGSIVLNNGVELPRVGLGTFRAKDVEVKAAVKTALKHGITHIDTAAIYKNEEHIAEALEEAGICRSEVFITSKVSPYQQGTQQATQAVEEILHRLRTNYVDLLLIHWPGAARTDALSPRNAELRRQTWQVLERCHHAGAARAIGVSNYSQTHLEQLLQHAAVVPAVNQVEVHPRLPCRQLRAVCATAGVAVVAYASLGCGELLAHSVVQGVAQRTGRTAGQVLLRWGLQSGCAVIPKSVHAEYIGQHSPQQLLTWQLGPEDMAMLDALEDGHKYCWDASGIL